VWLFLSARALEPAWTVPLYTSVAMPLVVLGLLSLCAIESLRALASSP
jgi:hypothetical protein